MANLLRLIVTLAEDDGARAEFLTDPEAALEEFDDLCSEDVAAALDIARQQVEPALSERLTDALATGPGRGESAREAALRALVTLCEAVTTTGASDDDGEHAVDDRPPGPVRPVHLWAMDGGSAGADDEHPSPAPTLAPVPDPPGGFEFSVLELVSLPDGLPDADIEPGTEATIVAVHRDPELSYEIEVSGDDGGRRFLGVVPTSAVAQRKF